MEEEEEHVWSPRVDGWFACGFDGCAKRFKRRDRLQIHVRTHTGERPFVCKKPGCGRSYCRASHLLRHEQKHQQQRTEASREYIKCTEEGCSELFTLKQNLDRHVRSHHSVEKNVYQCSVEGCGQTFRKHHQLRSHGYVHTQVNPYTCPEPDCGRTFKWPNLLRRHCKIHQGYQCDVEGCTQVCEKWTELRKHKATQHSHDYYCSQCEKTFNRRQTYTFHMQGHEGTRAGLSCPYDGCGRVYLDKRNLKTHVRRFHEKQRFACPHLGCDKTLASKQKLQHHTQLHIADPNSAGVKRKRDRKVAKPSKPRGPRRLKSLAASLTGLDEHTPTVACLDLLALQGDVDSLQSETPPTVCEQRGDGGSNGTVANSHISAGDSAGSTLAVSESTNVDVDNTNTKDTHEMSVHGVYGTSVEDGQRPATCARINVTDRETETNPAGPECSITSSGKGDGCLDLCDVTSITDCEMFTGRGYVELGPLQCVSDIGGVQNGHHIVQTATCTDVNYTDLVSVVPVEFNSVTTLVPSAEVSGQSSKAEREPDGLAALSTELSVRQTGTKGVNEVTNHVGLSARESMANGDGGQCELCLMQPV